MKMIDSGFFLLKDEIRIENGMIFIDYTGSFMEYLAPVISILC